MAAERRSAPERPAHPRAVRVGVTLALVLIVLDQATKELAESTLRRGQFVPWLGEHVGWQLVYNPGAAFGLPAPSWLYLVVTVLVLAIVTRTLPRSPTLVHAAAFGMLTAGALGNLIDRAFRPGDPGFLGGHVVDFVAWGAFPRFNVADAAITVGVALLFVALLHDERRDRDHEREGAEVEKDAASDGDVDGDGGEGEP